MVVHVSCILICNCLPSVIVTLKLSVCPDCYQELEQHFLSIKQSFNDSLEQLQQIFGLLGNESIPFSDQSVNAQELSTRVISEVNNSLSRYYSTIMQYEGLVFTINQTLLTQLSQIEVDLSDLRRISTTVLVLALTSEELMNRTMNEFNSTQQIVQNVQSATLLEIISVVDTIEDEYMGVSNITQDLIHSTQIVSSQINELRDLVSSTVIYSDSALSTGHSVQDPITVIEILSDNLEIVSVNLRSTTQSTESDVTALLTAVKSLASLIQQQLTTLQHYLPLQDSLSSLILNATNTENHAYFDVVPEINNQFNHYTDINRIIGLSTQNLNRLEANLTILENRTSSIFLELIYLETKTVQDILSAINTASLAQEALWQLQNFSGDSLSIADSAYQTVQGIQMVKIQTMKTQSLVDNITTDIELANAEIQSARHIATSAKNITCEMKQVNCSINKILFKCKLWLSRKWVAVYQLWFCSLVLEEYCT